MLGKGLGHSMVKFGSPGRAFAAKCGITGNHECPADWCSCGIYAAKNYEHLRRIAPPGETTPTHLDSVLHGEVYLWGRVVENQFGYQTQFAYPKTFVLQSNIDIGSGSWESCLESLMVYGVYILTSTNTLLW
jgi:hypothetical protein